MVEGLEVVACFLCQRGAPAVPRPLERQARHTAKGHFRQHEEVEVVQLDGVGFGQDGIGAIEVVGDIPNLGRKLKTGDPHVCGVWPGRQVFVGGAGERCASSGAAAGLLGRSSSVRDRGRWWTRTMGLGVVAGGVARGVLCVSCTMSYREWQNNDGGFKEGLEEQT